MDLFIISPRKLSTYMHMYNCIYTVHVYIFTKIPILEKNFTAKNKILYLARISYKTYAINSDWCFCNISGQHTLANLIRCNIEHLQTKSCIPRSTLGLTYSITYTTLSCSSIERALCNGRTIQAPVLWAYILASCNKEAISFIPLRNTKRSPRSVTGYYIYMNTSNVRCAWKIACTCTV